MLDGTCAYTCLTKNIFPIQPLSTQSVGMVLATLTWKKLWSKSDKSYFSKSNAIPTRLEGEKMRLQGGHNYTCLYSRFALGQSPKTSCNRFSTTSPIACLSTARCISAIFFSKHCTLPFCSSSIEGKFFS